MKLYLHKIFWCSSADCKWIVANLYSKFITYVCCTYNLNELNGTLFTVKLILIKIIFHIWKLCITSFIFYIVKLFKYPSAEMFMIVATNKHYHRFFIFFILVYVSYFSIYVFQTEYVTKKRILVLLSLVSWTTHAPKVSPFYFIQNHGYFNFNFLAFFSEKMLWI